MQSIYMDNIIRYMDRYVLWSKVGELQHYAEIVDGCTDTELGIKNKILKAFTGKISFYEIKVEKIVTNDGKRHILSIWYRAAKLPEVE